MQFHYSCFSSTQGTYLQKSRERVCYYKGDSSSQMYLSYLQKESESSVLRLFLPSPCLKACSATEASRKLYQSFLKKKRRKKPFDQRLSTFFAPSFPDVLWNFANHKSRKPTASRLSFSSTKKRRSRKKCEKGFQS